MKEYKRLTKWETSKGVKCVKYWQYSQEQIAERLALLEDMIENGTLVIANKPFVVLDYISNGQEYYVIRVAEEKDLSINLTKADAEKKLKELKEEV